MLFRVALVCFLACAGRAGAEPALWRAAGPHGAVYLFGTMHILPKRGIWFTPKIAAAFAASDTLWEEADVGLVNPEMAAKLMQRAMAPDFDLSAVLPAKTAASLQAQLRGCGLDFSVVRHVRLWMVTQMVTVCQLQAESKAAGSEVAMGPETALLDQAHAAHKSVKFFETAEDQIAIMASGTEKAQLAQLDDTIKEGADGKQKFAAMQQAWLSGDMNTIASDVAEMRGKDADFYRLVFTDRNARFADRIAAMIHDGGTHFVAIGAGHFAGPDSVLAVLARHGARVERE